MILHRNERSARREVTCPTQNIGDDALFNPLRQDHYYHQIMDNTSGTNADKASVASSWSPSKWVAGLMGRQEPVAATANAVDATTSATAAAASTAAAATAAAAAVGSRLTTTTTAQTSIAGTNTTSVTATKRKKSTSAAATITTIPVKVPAALYTCPTSTCDWAIEQCYMIGLLPKKC